ncbi:MAG TPA: hypothetical protein VGN32_07320 [Ktedonobacterales bacterium]|nr:hypothetical protein [Ktedonobacterales bacterium]
MRNPTASGNGSVSVTLRARPERRLIRTNGSMRHVDFHFRWGSHSAVTSGSGCR